MQITVVGAGVMGLTTALALSERGFSVGVVERSATLGASACSRFAGGMLAPWCEAESAEPLVVRLGQEALAYWPRVFPGTIQRGSLVLAPLRDAPDLARFARRTTDHEMLDADGIAALEPDLAGRFRSGLFFRREAHLDPRAALPALAESLAVRGVSITFGQEVDPADPSLGAVADCRGLAAQDRLPDLRGVKGEMLILRCPGLTLTRPVRMLHPRFPLYVVPRGDGVFMLGATMLESGERARVTARSVVELLNAAYALHPAFAEAEILEMGADARPAFADNLPRLRPFGQGSLRVNGLFRHGFLLSPAMASRAADYFLNRTVSPEVMG
ncbi:MAG TPA: FAD-dependent oxidoreductase [Acidisoma sp.]|uniref:FAD-dependent oxidoreductase n=1 Tax=Acidisoma sp. TaxID=1872115 RepID=UPI002C587B88|nr:FAD-dependent oxidoreductase [Acidisoma sp.]HTI01061.1 FAD-dependent oxidoreductase [Acidisoma sp.]